VNPFNFANTKNSTWYLSNILRVNHLSDQILPGEYALGKIEKSASTLKAWVTADQCLTDQQRTSLGFTLENMMLSCFYDNMPCNVSHFTRLSWNNEFGNCYTFNGLYDAEGRVQKSRLTSKPGIRNGLSLELFTGVFSKL
jgi:hypothetical protein